MYQPPNALSCVGEVSHAFFNISRLNKSRQYFKMVDEKNNVTFNISEQFKTFRLCKKKFHQMKWNILWNFGLGIWDPSMLLNYELTYACIHGGKKFKPRGKGARQTSLVVLLILNSSKNHAKVKIASTSSH